MSRVSCIACVQVLDPNGDGTISYGEFMAAVNKSAAAVATEKRNDKLGGDLHEMNKAIKVKEGYFLVRCTLGNPQDCTFRAVPKMHLCSCIFGSFEVLILHK